MTCKSVQSTSVLITALYWSYVSGLVLKVISYFAL